METESGMTVLVLQGDLHISAGPYRSLYVHNKACMRACGAGFDYIVKTKGIVGIPK